MTDDFEPKPFAMPPKPIPVGPAKGKTPGVQTRAHMLPDFEEAVVPEAAPPDRHFFGEDDPYDIVLAKLYFEQQLIRDVIATIERLKGQK
jgi:hypothetical protein